MTQIELETVLKLVGLGYALGSIPTLQSSQLLIAALGKWFGVSPRDVQQYNAATDTDPETEIDGATEAEVTET
jgi:hypothetical protein